jgi:hypothetical protein
VVVLLLFFALPFGASFGLLGWGIHLVQRGARWQGLLALGVGLVGAVFLAKLFLPMRSIQC